MRPAKVDVCSRRAKSGRGKKFLDHRELPCTRGDAGWALTMKVILVQIRKIACVSACNFDPLSGGIGVQN
jgi:hypothetical protein